MRVNGISLSNPHQANGLQHAAKKKNAAALLQKQSIAAQAKPKPGHSAQPKPAAPALSTAATTKEPSTVATSAEPSQAKPLTTVGGAVPIYTAATDPAPPVITTPELSLDELIKAWGTANSTYDLNGDGTVNVDDLLALINKMPVHPDPTDPAPIEPAPVDPAAMDPAATKLAPAPPSPIDPAATQPPAIDPAPIKPGEVPPQPTTGTEPQAIDPATDPLPAPQPTTEESPTLSGLLKAWGQANPTYDLTGDGTVNVNDLLAFLNSMPVGSNSSDAETHGLNGAGLRAALSPDHAPGKSAGHALGGIAALTNSLLDNLTAAGFADQPPINIRELVDGLKLSPKQSQFMLKRLDEKYPEGLGLNMVG